MTRVLSRAVVVLLAVLALVVPTDPAEAAWSASGQGTTSGLAVTLSAPAGLTVICPALTLAAPKVSWTALPYPARYDIYRKTGNGAGLGTVISTAQTFGIFTDLTAPSRGLGLFDTVTYAVQAVQVWASGPSPGWTSPIATASSVQVTLGKCIL